MKLMIVLALFPIISFGQNPSIPLPYGYKDQVKDTTPSFVILKELKSKVFDSTYQASSLTHEEIDTILKMLRKKLKEETTRVAFEKYKMQLIPAINKSGEKVIFINGFCRQFDNWQKKFIMVSDGGECFFQAEINLKQLKFILFGFNGVA